MPTRKVLAATIAGLFTFALTKLAVQLDPVLEQAINVLAMIVAGYLIPNEPNGQVEAESPAYYEPEGS